jgi:hydroxymethylpyrimidine pyrophosphatase-like HAD family hydrolase
VKPLRLISSDFDGTLISPTSDRCSPRLAEALEAHHAAGGLWAVNTGRTLDHAIDGLLRFDSPVAPDFLLTNEREVYRWDGTSAWLAHGDWNRRCETRHDELFDTALEVFETFEDLARRNSGLRLIYERKRPVGLVAETEILLDEMIAEIDSAAGRHIDFCYQRNSIYLRFCHRDYHKGSALGELCRLEGIDITEVFAVGDHFNDIPMLDGRHAALTACPANAIGPVKETVHLSTGYISSQPWADGVAEALGFYGSQRQVK